MAPKYTIVYDGEGNAREVDYRADAPPPKKPPWEQERSNLGEFEFFERFSNEAAAVAFFEQVRWGDGLYCPRCSSEDCYETPNRKPMSHWCPRCRRHFSVRTGTVMADTNLPLKKWARAIHLIHTDRNGVSSVRISRKLSISQKSAWFLMHRIREGMGFEEVFRTGQLEGEIEVDEAFIGGRPRWMHKDKREEARAKPNLGKTIVQGFRQREGGLVRLKVIPDTTAETLEQGVRDVVAPGSSVYTDANPSYGGLKDAGYDHDAVFHSGEHKQYVKVRTDADGNLLRNEHGEALVAYNNGIESIWALFKRGYHTIYTHVSAEHLQRYLDETAYRASIGDTNNLSVIGRTINDLSGKRLTYKRLTGKEDG